VWQRSDERAQPAKTIADAIQRMWFRRHTLEWAWLAKMWSVFVIRNFCTVWNNSLAAGLRNLAPKKGPPTAFGFPMRSDIEDGKKADEEAVQLLLRSEDNRRALRKLLNLSVDMKLPAMFTALLDELDKAQTRPRG